MGDEVIEVYEVLRERLKSGIRRILEIDRKQPHFIPVVVMAIGCEAVGQVLQSVDGQERKPWDVFVEEMILPHGLTRDMGFDLFQSIRNGLAHSYFAKRIVLKDERAIVVGVNWGDGVPHLKLRNDPPSIWLSLSQMQTDFEAMLDKYRGVVQQTSTGGRTMSAWWNEKAARGTSFESDSQWARFLEGKTP
mgnify:CR=1 FL=1|jgi:hypothetical protein